MFPRCLALLVLVCSGPDLPGQPPIGGSGRAGLSVSALRPFLDFHDDLGRRSVRVYLAELGRVRELSRKRLKDGDAHLGTGTGVQRVSGVQFFKVRVRAMLSKAKQLHGPTLKGRCELRFECQLARLPGGEERRQWTGQGRAVLPEGAAGLFVVEAARRGRGQQLLHFLARPAKVKPEAFAKDVADLLACNQLILRLELALRSAKARAARAPAAARAEVQAALAAKLSCQNPRNDALTGAQLEPWRRRLRALLKKLEESR